VKPPEPRLVAILCHYCSYSASDSAARAKLPLPAGLLTLRVPCTGRVDPELVVRAFEKGADGVLVGGCHPGDCHFQSGNYRALGRFRLLQRLFEYLGVEPGRLRLEWISAQEGQRYAAVAAEMADSLRALGPARWRSRGPALLANDGPGGSHR
jgi:F420-non-reducing hydrogenase iron-sulfur subunit